jgi:hypothetical protein
VVSYRFRPRLSFQLGLGAVVDGSLRPPGGEAVDVGIGPAVTVGASWLPVYETRLGPFLALSATAGVTTASTATARMTAVDFRAGVSVGKTFLDRLTVYLAARAFAGPVSWRIAGADVTGGDVHHYSLGGGARVALPASLDLFVEGMAAGEQSLNAGLGVTW